MATRSTEVKVVPTATYQDVLDAPPNKVAQIVDGILYTHPRPAPLQAIATSQLGACLIEPFRFGRGGPGGWWIINEPELHLGEDILVPDLAGWRQERMPTPPKTAYFEIRPDWVCEVLSPTTRALDQGKKRSIYAKEGLSYLWFIDPEARTLEAFELKDERWVLLDTATGDEDVSLPPFDAVQLSLSDLWWPVGGP